MTGTTLSIEQCRDVLNDWDGNRVDDEFRSAIRTIAQALNHRDVIQALEGVKTRSAGAGSGGHMGYGGINSP